MIYCLTGKILKKSLDSVVISCAGVGYYVQVPATTGEALPAPGQEGTVYTIMNVTENDVSLYGFANEEQRDCFKMLTAVTGVGPKAGLSILSIMSPEKVALAASSGDYKAFTKASGVGPKLAQRIALELKDKVGKGLANGNGFSGSIHIEVKRLLRQFLQRIEDNAVRHTKLTFSIVVGKSECTLDDIITIASRDAHFTVSNLEKETIEDWQRILASNHFCEHVELAAQCRT